MTNTAHFKLISGNPAAWDAEILKAKAKDQDPRTRNRTAADFNLCAMQVSQHRRGRRSASLLSTLYGWGVRLASGLDNRRILLSGRRQGRQISFQEAVKFGIEWTEQDPDNREFFVSSYELDRARKAGEDLSFLED